MKKTVYCVCSDNDVVIEAGEDGKVRMIQPAP
jgi:hypothetical protein